MSSPNARRAGSSAKKIAGTLSTSLFAIVCTLSSAAALPAQTAVAPTQAGSVSASATRATTSAARTGKPPVIDGRDGDAAWAEAAPITAFRQVDPAEDAEPTMRTEARITHDDAISRRSSVGSENRF